MTNWGKFSRIVAEAKASRKLDPVGEEDDDVDNDGDSDSSDSYLKKRRASVGAAIAADRKSKVQSDCKEELIGNQKEIDANNNGKVDAHDFALLRAKKKVKKEEVEQIHEIPLALAAPLVVGGVGLAANAIGKSMNKFVDQQRSKKQSDYAVPAKQGGLGAITARMRSGGLESYQPEGEQLDEFLFGPSKVTPKGGQLSGSKAPVEVDKKYIAQKQGQLVNVQYDKEGNRKISKMTPIERGTAALKIRQSGGGASSPSMNQYQTQSFEPEGELVDEGKVELKRRNKNEMQRKAGNLGRQVVSTPNTKKHAAKRNAAMDRMKKLVSVIARDDEEKRFKTIGQSPAHNEEFVGENKEHEREMRKAAARERAEERREKGGKAARSPGREGPSAGKSYADYQEISIKAHDKITKKNKNPIGLVAKEENEIIDEGIRSAVKRLLGGKEEKEAPKPESRGEQLRKKYNVGPEKSDTSAKRQILDRSRARKERDQRDYGDSTYSKSVAKKSADAHDRYLRAGYSKYGADDARGSGNKARKRAAALNREELEFIVNSLIEEGYDLSSYTWDEMYQICSEEMEYIEEKGMSRDEMSSVLTGHKYSKLQLLDMSKKSTREGRHGEAAALYDKFKEEYISEKSLSRAQQRFFGMVRAEQKGEMEDASPKVKEAAKSMKEKDVHDFASTKHKGLPEKKGDCKEEMSLVERILAEATDAERMAAKARREEREEKQNKRMRAAKLSVAANQVLKGLKDEKEDEPRTRESAGERVQRLKNERQEKMDAAKDKRQARADARKDAEEEKKKKEKEKEERNKKIEDAKNLKKKQRSELKSSIQSAFPRQLEVASSEKDTDAASAMVGNIGRVAGGLAKTGFALGKYGVQRAMARRNQSKDKNEQFSNWREEFILEVDDQNLAANPKVIDVSKKKNKIEINPNMSEGSDCGGKDETPKKDMRDLRTKVNLAKTKARLMGDKNPMVMIAAEELETKDIQEVAPIVPLVARLLGGAASRSVATRIAGSSVKGSLRSMAGEIAGDKVGEIVQDRLTPKPKDKSEEDENSLDIGNRKVRNEGAAWTNKEGKNPSGGLNEKGRKSYERDNPGSDLKAPSKKVGNPRRKSFCARMKGMKAKLTSAKTARDPDSRINKSLRAWNC